MLGYTDYNTGYFLMQLDSLFKQKSMKTLPASYRLTSMKPTGDGNYIFTGTTSGFTRNNELVKLKADGTFIWNRISSAPDDTYTTATPTADGGYIVLGTHPVKDITTNIFDYARVKKFDANGNMQWDRSLNGEGMIQAKELVVEQDGVVLAGLKKGAACSSCDSLLIAKLDNAGNLIWQNAVFGGLNTSLLSGMRTVKHTNGSYVVSINNTRGVFIFSNSGVFLDRKLARNSINGFEPKQNYRTSTAKGDRTLILESGFDVTSDHSRGTEPPSIEKLEVELGQSGEATIRIKNVTGVKAYIHQYTMEPPGINTIWNGEGSSDGIHTFQGLTPEKRYWFRVVVIGFNKQKAYSPVVSRVIQ